MEKTAVDELAVRNATLQARIETMEVENTTHTEEIGRLKTLVETKERDAHLARRDQLNAERFQTEAVKRKAVLEHQVSTTKDQTAKVGKLERSNKSLKEKVATLEKVVDNLRRSQTDTDELGKMRETIKSLKRLLEDQRAKTCEATEDTTKIHKDLLKAQKAVETKTERIAHLERLLGDKDAIPHLTIKVKDGLQILGKNRLTQHDKGLLRETFEELQKVMVA